jgi:preprotein translocase subunit SecG
LEGWSDIQVQIEQVSSQIAVIYFTMIVFAGAFFLLNLTLAVINSKFTEAHGNHQQSESKTN